MGSRLTDSRDTDRRILVFHFNLANEKGTDSLGARLMNCQNCGRETSEADRFCPWCGGPQGNSSGIGTTESDVEYSETASSMPPVSSPEDRELGNFDQTLTRSQPK